MNYFPFHVGDYAAHTGHLDLLEDLAYRRMLDAYYLREMPMPADPVEVARLIRMRKNVAEVESVLREFFDLTDQGWMHARCEEELERMQDKQAKARASAAASVNARRAKAIPPLNERTTDAEHSVNERSTDVELPTPTPTPTPKKEHSPTPRKRGNVRDFPPGFESVWLAYPRKIGKAAAAKAFARIRPDQALIDRILAAIRQQELSPQWMRDGGQFIPHLATWLNAGRWEDQLPSMAGASIDIFAGAR